MKVFIINSGSSSLKFKLFDMPAEHLICSGMVERIGSGAEQLIFRSERGTFRESIQLKSHRAALQKIVEWLLNPDWHLIQTKEEIKIVGHRVVHGGDRFSGTTPIDEAVIDEVRRFSDLAPLHNPSNLEGIEVAGEIFPHSLHYAVFDTGFHQTIPEVARRYAIPSQFLTQHGIQVYGFHGISHQYVSRKAIEFLDLPSSKIITIHLGNGCSMTAVTNGRSVDHSMGFSPGDGLIMGSRSGDIDPGVIFHLIRHLGYTPEAVDKLLTKESGMLGLTGFSDLRDIESRARDGDEAAILALGMSAYRIRKYIGAYSAVMNGLDAIVFTAGIGEHSSRMRQLVCADMDHLGISLDPEKNENASGSIRSIGSHTSRVAVLVISTNEELEIARQVYQAER